MNIQQENAFLRGVILDASEELRYVLTHGDASYRDHVMDKVALRLHHAYMTIGDTSPPQSSTHTREVELPQQVRSMQQNLDRSDHVS